MKRTHIIPWIVVGVFVVVSIIAMISGHHFITQANNRRCTGLFALAATRTDSVKVAVDSNCAWYLDQGNNK